MNGELVAGAPTLGGASLAPSGGRSSLFSIARALTSRSCLAAASHCATVRQRWRDAIRLPVKRSPLQTRRSARLWWRACCCWSATAAAGSGRWDRKRTDTATRNRAILTPFPSRAPKPSISQNPEQSYESHRRLGLIPCRAVHAVLGPGVRRKLFPAAFMPYPKLLGAAQPISR